MTAATPDTGPSTPTSAPTISRPGVHELFEAMPGRVKMQTLEPLLSDMIVPETSRPAKGNN
jgi:hypothetical protein